MEEENFVKKKIMKEFHVKNQSIKEYRRYDSFAYKRSKISDHVKFNNMQLMKRLKKRNEK